MKISKQVPEVIVPPTTILLELTLEEAKDLAVIIGGTTHTYRQNQMGTWQEDHLQGRTDGEHLNFFKLYVELAKATK